MIIYVKDFTKTPRGRYRINNDFSAEEFRDDILIPSISKAISEDESVIINLDGTYGYPTLFLDEAFGKLVKYFSKSDLKNIRYISNDEPSLIDDIIKYYKNN